MEKKTIPIRCPKCKALNTFIRDDFKGKDRMAFKCKICGFEKDIQLGEDVSQAAVRIVREATDNH